MNNTLIPIKIGEIRIENKLNKDSYKLISPNELVKKVGSVNNYRSPYSRKRNFNRKG